MIPQLTPRLKRMLRRCFVKIDENTIEIKEKRGVIIKLWVLFTMMVFGYYNFIHPDYRQTTFDDLKIGMEMTGTVRNVVDFGAFVDIGLKNDGLVHISQISDRFIKHPMDAVSVGDVVKVQIIDLDNEKQKIGLTMKIRKDKNR